MKILHVLFQFPGKTGSGIYLNNLILEGSKNGYEQGLVAALGLGHSYENSLLSIMELVRFETDKLPFPIPGMSDIMPYKSTKYKDLSDEALELWKKEFRASILKAVDDFDPDVILSHHLWLGTSLLTEMNLNKRILGICHSTDLRQLNQNPKYLEYVVTGCRKLDKIFALNQNQKNEIEKAYGIQKDLIEVAGGGYDSKIFHSQGRKSYSEPFKLVYAGKLSYSKGLLPLIEVFSKLSKELDIHMYLTGSGTGSEEAVIKAKAASAGVIMLGSVSQKKLGEIFRESDIFILPSYYEGLPLVLLEALACGLPSAVTEIGGLRDYLGTEIIESKVIEFVPLPVLKCIDVPEEESLEEFKDNLELAIKKQIENLNGGYIKFAPLLMALKDLSWEGVFKRIERFL